MNKVYLTKEKLEELKKELVDLKTRARKEIAERLKQAKELGDLSENAEFSTARDEQRLLEERVNELEEIIREAFLIQKSKGGQTVKIGSTLQVQRGSEILAYTIVGSQDSQPGKGLISNESPLGKSFLGKKIGEMVVVKTPRGAAKYKILKIE